MKISGFTFVRNALELDFPFRESVLSILTLVDEYVIAYCEGDPDDGTLALINSIDSNKIKVVDCEWNPKKYYKNTLYAHLTDIAKNNCSGDWLFYLQGDEVIHEDYLSMIKKACKHYIDNPEIEGLLFEYKHFWGDYDHCFSHHGWYPREIRIIRNRTDIHSWRDAQSFRVIHEFNENPEDYLKKENTEKLKVASIPAYIFHYGWVRNPIKMRQKQSRMEETWDPTLERNIEPSIDYGPMSMVPKFNGSHPHVMQNRIAELDWQDVLQQAGKPRSDRKKYKHEKLKYRLRTWFEVNVLGGKEIGGFKNYKLVDRWKPEIATNKK